jgi:dihydrofolate reductase
MDGVRTSRCWTVTSSRKLQKLRQELDAEIVVNRSAQPVQPLNENNPVYELRLMIYPVVLGAEKARLRRPTDKKTLRHVDSNSVGDGIVILTHAPTRAQAPG